MILMPIVFVSDMERAIAFYEKLGLSIRAESGSPVWTELVVGDSILALHAASDVERPERPPIKLAFLATEPLEDIAGRLEAVGMPVQRGIAEERFGRSMVVRDPDGLLIHIDERTPSAIL